MPRSARVRIPDPGRRRAAVLRDDRPGHRPRYPRRAQLPRRAFPRAVSGVLRRAAARQHADLCPDDLTGFVFPGIPNLLTGLSARHGRTARAAHREHPEIALLKLIHAGLAPFFTPAVGAFGCDAEDRLALAPIARARAGAGASAAPAASAP